MPVTEKGAAKLAAYLGVYFSRSKKNPTEVPELHFLPLPPRARAEREAAKPAKPPSAGGTSKRSEMQVAATPAKRQRCVRVRGTSPPTSPPRSADADEAEAEAEAVRVRVRVRVGEGGTVRVEAEADSDVHEAAACAVCGSAKDEPGRDDILLCDACDAGHHMRSLTLTLTLTLTLSLTLSLTSTLTLTRLPHALPAAAARCGARGRLVLPAVRATDGEPRRR